MSEMIYRGSCLCGEVEYEVTGEATRFYHCHCQRCRKATGTGHASNLFIKAGEVNWLKGEARIARYKIPEAERFTNSFCSQCGSRLPRYVPELGVVMLPAGSLENEPDIKPQAHIFCDSRASWSSCDGDIPSFAEYMPEK